MTPIRTTHVGSLPRPHDLLDLMKARLSGASYDAQRYESRVKSAVAECVRKQVDCGIDIVADGEQSKPGFFTYVKERLAGFEPRPAKKVAFFEAERQSFPEYYDEYFARAMKGGAVAPVVPMVCTGPVTYKGEQALRRDIDNLKSAMAASGARSAFMPSVAPSGAGSNEYYKSDEEFFFAVAEAMRTEYKAIVDAGFLLQLDDARAAVTYDRMVPPAAFADYRKWVDMHMEVLNHAIEGLPPERIRYHVCGGSWPGPHTTDVPLKEIVDLILKVKVGAYVIEGANPRHEHEWKVWKDVKLPDGKVLIPGVISHATNVVEHPELVAERIGRYARLVGRENVLAGTDCGFAQGPFYRRVHPSIMWAKLEALAQGARLASKELWS